MTLARAAAGLGLLALLPATVLSGLRLIRPDDAAGVRLVAFTPLGLPLHLVALALLTTALLARRRSGTAGRLRALPVAAGLAVVGAGLHAWWLAPDWIDDAPAPAAGARPMTVLTANVYEGRGSPRDVVDAVRRYDVDVLVLVEVRTPMLEAADAAGLADLLPHRAATPLWSDQDAGTTVLSRTPLGPPQPVATTHESWLVEVSTDAGPLSLLAGHPAAPTDVAAWRADHEVLRATMAAERPDLVAGDLNATLDHRPMQALAADGYRDAARLAGSGWAPTWPAEATWHLPIALPLVAIDHVLVAPGWTVLATETVAVADSDHRALVARVARS